MSARELSDAECDAIWQRQHVNGVASRRAIVRAAYAAGRAAGMESAAKVCESEVVDADATGEQSDHAYNLATEHCAAAIRALAEEKA